MEQQPETAQPEQIKLDLTAPADALRLLDVIASERQGDRNYHNNIKTATQTLAGLIPSLTADEAKIAAKE